MGKFTADIKAFCEENGLDYNIFAGLINIKCPHRVKGKIRIDEENGKWDCLACNIQSKDHLLL